MTTKSDITTANPTLTSLLRHLPREMRVLVAAVDEIREKWDTADEMARHELWGAVDSASVAVHLTADHSLLAVLAAVVAERGRQNELWGEQNWHDFEGVSILTEEVGEAAKAANEANFTSGKTPGDYSYLREELVQVAAVAVNHIQSIDRRMAKEAERGN